MSREALLLKTLAQWVKVSKSQINSEGTATELEAFRLFGYADALSDLEDFLQMNEEALRMHSKHYDKLLTAESANGD